MEKLLKGRAIVVEERPVLVTFVTPDLLTCTVVLEETQVLVTGRALVPAIVLLTGTCPGELTGMLEH